jgi:hypothetical protein
MMDEWCIWNRIISEDEISQLNAAPIATAVESAGKMSMTWASIKELIKFQP